MTLDTFLMVLTLLVALMQVALVIVMGLFGYILKGIWGRLDSLSTENKELRHEMKEEDNSLHKRIDGNRDLIRLEVAKIATKAEDILKAVNQIGNEVAREYVTKTEAKEFVRRPECPNCKGP